MHRTTMLGLPAAVLAFWPAVAYADAGTPLIWATGLHLLIGNALIGIVEGLALALLFRQRRIACVPIMIAANYFSAWVSGLVLIPAIVGRLDLDLYNAWHWLWRMVVVTYFLTLLLEWPFVAVCLRKTRGWLRKSVWGCLAVQSASYAVLFGWYWAASRAGLYTDLDVVRPSAISVPKNAVLYYIAESDGDVYAWDPGKGETRRVLELKSFVPSDRLLLRESRTAAGRWDLIAESGDADPNPSERVVCADLRCIAAEPPGTLLRPGGDVPRFRADKSGWEFRFGWMAGGLYGVNTADGRTLDVSLETVFVRWPVGYPTQLPNGQVVFQLGRNQICLLDPDERKVALLAKGRGPVVAMKDGPE